MSNYYAKILGINLVSHKADFDALRKLYDDCLSTSSGEKETIEKLLSGAEQHYKSRCKSMRLEVEEVSPGRFDAIEKLHLGGLIDHDEMVKMWVAAAQPPTQTPSVNLPDTLSE